MRTQDRTAGLLSPRAVVLWYGVLGPPMAWAAQVVGGDLLFELGCGPAIRGGSIFFLSLKGWSQVLTGVCAAAALLGLVLSWGSFRALRGVHDGGAAQRATAFATAGVAVGLVFLILISYGFLVPLFLRTCARSP